MVPACGPVGENCRSLSPELTGAPDVSLDDHVPLELRSSTYRGTVGNRAPPMSPVFDRT
jgi:hypothetical protein